MTFRPDWTSPPGATLLDIVGEMGLTNASAAERLGLSLNDYWNLVEGHLKIDASLAQRLEELTTAPAVFWIRREQQYRQDLIRLAREQSAREVTEDEYSAIDAGVRRLAFTMSSKWPRYWGKQRRNTSSWKKHRERQARRGRAFA